MDTHRALLVLNSKTVCRHSGSFNICTPWVRATCFIEQRDITVQNHTNDSWWDTSSSLWTLFCTIDVAKLHTLHYGLQESLSVCSRWSAAQSLPYLLYPSQIALYFKSTDYTLMQSALLNMHTGAADAAEVLWHLILLSSTIQGRCCFCNQIGKWHRYTCWHHHYVCQQHFRSKSCAKCRGSGHLSDIKHTEHFPVSETFRLNRSYSRSCRLKMWWCVLGGVGKVLQECM